MTRILLLLSLLIHPLFSDTKALQKVVFDCSSDNLSYVGSRFWLIEESAKEYLETKTPYEMVLTIHSGCIETVSKEAAFGDSIMQKIQKKLTTLMQTYHVRVEACNIALNRYGIEKSDQLDGIHNVRNSITRVIELQNKGYAIISFD